MASVLRGGKRKQADTDRGREDTLDRIVKKYYFKELTSASTNQGLHVFFFPVKTNLKKLNNV